MLYLVLILFLAIFGLIVFYLLYRVQKSYFIQKIVNKKIRYFIIFLELVTIGIFMFIDMINTMIIIIHLFFITLFLNIIYFIIKKITKKQFKYNITMIISILLTTIYMIHGYYLAYDIVETDYLLYTNKNIEDFRIVQISDSHLGTTISGDEFKNYMIKINKLNPDIVVITGDFIDDDTSYDNFIKGCEALGLLNTKYGVYFIYGNHDKGYFNNRKYNENDIKNELIKNNVVILEDEISNITDNIILIGRKDHKYDRLTVDELIKDVDKDKYIVLLDHQPRDFENEEGKVDLVLSGHTHGGQFIPVGWISVLLGINDGYYGLSTKNNTNFIISSGISNWAFKFKTGCISEYVVIDIKKK